MKMSEQEFEALVQVEDRLARLSVEAKEMADGCGLTRRALAERLGHASPSTVQRVVSGAAYRSTVETLAHLAWACGYELELTLRPRRVGTSPAPARSTFEPDNLTFLDDYKNWVAASPSVRWTPSRPVTARCEDFAACGA